MSLLDGKLDAQSLMDNISSLGWLVICGVSFASCTIALPLFAFGTFTAKDENGWITGLLMLLVVVWLISGLLFVVMGIVILIQRRHERDDTLLQGPGDTLS